MRSRQNGRHFADDIFKCTLLNECVWLAITTSLKFVPKGPINNTPALVQIKAWRRPGDKPLSEPMMVSLPTHMCVTRPQWVKATWYVSVKPHKDNMHIFNHITNHFRYSTPHYWKSVNLKMQGFSDVCGDTNAHHYCTRPPHIPAIREGLVSWANPYVYTKHRDVTLDLISCRGG